MSTQTLPNSVHGSQTNFALITPTKRTSKTLFGFGIAEIIFSIFLFSSCIWSASFNNEIIVSYIGFGTAIFHTILGILAILAAQNLDQHRGSLIACLVMGIVGSCIFVVAAITAGSLEWSNYEFSCWYCRYYSQYDRDLDSYSYRCLRRCAISEAPIFLPILLFSIAEAIVGIVLSSLACCNLSSCCNNHAPANVYHQYHQQPPQSVQVPAYPPQSYPQHLHVIYPPPHYTESTPTTTTSDQSPIPSIHQSNII